MNITTPPPADWEQQKQEAYAKTRTIGALLAVLFITLLLPIGLFIQALTAPTPSKAGVEIGLDAAELTVVG